MSAADRVTGRVAGALEALLVPVDSLVPFPGNPNVGDVAAIAESLQVNSQYRPIVVQASTGRILAGNHTWLAAQSLGWADIAAVRIDVDDDEARRIVAADNRTAQLTHYDDRALLDLLTSISGDGGLAGTGWGQEDLQALLDLNTPAAVISEPADDDQVPEAPVAPRTKPGDVWLLGPHRQICGDCRDPDTVRQLLDGKAINMAFTSPPYASQRTY